jgi:hypothetical protein
MSKATKQASVEKKTRNKENKRSVATKVGTFLLGGMLMTGIGVKLTGCSDEGPEERPKPCYTEYNEAGTEVCLSRDENVKCAMKMLPVDASVSEAVATDAGVTDTKQTPDSNPTDAEVTDANPSDAAVADAGEAQKLRQACVEVTESDAAVEDSSVDAGVADTGVVTDTGVVADTGVVEDTNVVPDVGLTPDMGLPPDTSVVDAAVDTGPSCAPVPGDIGEVESTSNVTLNGNPCGQTKCDGVVGIGDVIDIKGAKYTVDSVANGKLTAKSGDYSIVATQATSSGTATCSLWHLNSEKGDCATELGGALYLVGVNSEDLNATGRATLTMSLLQTFPLYNGTKTLMLTEGESEKTVTLGPDVTVKVWLVTGTGDRAYVAVDVFNSDTNTSSLEPQGKMIEVCCSTTVGQVNFIAEGVSDNTNALCTKLEASLVIDGGNKKVKDGDVVLVNQKQYKVDIQFTEGDTAGTFVSLVDTTATKNADNVIGYSKTATVNGKNVTFQDLDVNSKGAYAPDAGVPTDVGTSG